MSPKFNTGLLFFCLSLSCCLHCIGQEKIYFEPGTALSGKQSDFLTCNNVVVFETTSESKFDRYSSIVPTKNFFIVYDYSAKKTLVFRKDGRFVKKFSTRVDFGGFDYNKENDRLEMVVSNKMFRLTNKDNAQVQEDYKNPKNFKYFKKYFIDLTDTVNFTVHKQKIEPNDILKSVSYVDGMHILNQVTVGKYFSKKEDYELKIYRGDSLLKQYFMYDKQKDSRYIFDGGWVSISPASKEGEKWVTHPYDYTIYLLNKDSLYKVYDIVLPIDRVVPAEFFTREFQNRTDKDNFLRQNRKSIRQIYVTDLSSRYLSFYMQSVAYERQQFLYDTKKKIFYNYDKITADSLTYYLPVNKNIAFTDGNAIYARIFAEDALKMAEEHKKDNMQYPPLLEAYLKTANNDSNPVLINFNYRN